jgi:hypothetical protein
MKAIFTTAHGAHRLRATDGDGNTVIVDRAAELNLEAQHDAAALALCARMNWTGTLVKGHVLRAEANIGRVYVWSTSDTTLTV